MIMSDKITFKKTQESFVSDEKYTSSVSGVTQTRYRFVRIPAQWAVFRGDELVAEIRGRNSRIPRIGWYSSWNVLAPGTPKPITGSVPFKSFKEARAWAVKNLSGRSLVEILKPDIEPPLSARREGIKRILEAGPEFITIPRSVIWESGTYRDLGEVVTDLIIFETIRTITPLQIKIVKEIKRNEECAAEHDARKRKA